MKNKKDMINTCALSLIEFIEDQKLIDEKFARQSKILVEQWRRHIIKILEKED